MERVLIEYAANAVWQLPLLAAGAWLLVRVARPGAAAQHRIWVGVLALAVVLPLRGAFAGSGAGMDGVVVPVSASGPVHGSAPVRAEGAAVAPAAGAAPASGSFSGDEFNHVGEPGGLVLGARRLAAQDAAGKVMAAGAEALAFVARVRWVRLNATAAGWLAGMYLLVMLLGLYRLARAWSGARRLARDSQVMTLSGRERALVEDCARRTGVATPEMRASGEVSGPVVVGMRHPVLLWPEGLGAGLNAGLCAEDESDEVTAALCHEMAHIRRRDFGMNLLCEAAVVPLRWHPVAHGVGRQIRSTREMACDAMAAAAMESQMRYAKCLLRLAESMAAGSMAEQAGALGLFHGNVLEERVMRLMETKTAMSARAKVARAVAGGTAMLAAVGLAAAFYVIPAMAQGTPPTTTSTTTTTQSEVLAPPVAPAPLGPAAGVPAQPAVAPVAKLAPLPPLPPLPPLHSARMGVAPLPPLPPLPRARMSAAPLPPLPALPGQAAPEAAPKPAPAPPSPPAPAPAPRPGAKGDSLHVHRTKDADGRSFVIVNGEERDLTPAERARVEKQLEEAQKKIAAATARLDSPEFKARMADAQKQIAETEAKLQSPEFRKQMEDAAHQQAMAEIDSAKFKQQMAEAQKQIAAAAARLNSPEFKAQIEAAAKVNTSQIEKQMAEAQKQLQQEMEKLKAEQEKDAPK